MEINQFFSISVVIVIMIYMLQHFVICCTRGVPGATHGRYYYIALVPGLYLVFNAFQYISQKVLQYIPVVLGAILIVTEYNTVLRCLEVW